MCDRCLFKNRVHPRDMNIAPLCIDVLKILERAQLNNAKLTGLKLIDAWFHKGASNLQITSIPKPNLDRYFTEQIITYLMLEGFLKEDFSYTAYSTISYIQRGNRLCNSTTQINFRGSQILNLPSKGICRLSLAPDDKNHIEIKTIADSTDEEIVPKKKRKKSRRSSDDSLQQDKHGSFKSSRKSTSAKFDNLVSDVISKERARASRVVSIDDDVVLLPQQGEVIEID